MTSSEVAALLKLKSQTLAKWRCTKSVELPYLKLGNRVLYKESDVSKFIKENEISFSLLATRRSHKSNVIINLNDFVYGGCANA